MINDINTQIENLNAIGRSLDKLDGEANNIQIGAFALEPDTEYSLSVTVTDVTDQHLQIYCAQCTITE